jgi:hypothetical protein
MSKATRKNGKSRRDDLRREYQFDYSACRPNRFASRLRGDAIAVVLEPDVAEVFGSSQSVNQLLRSVIAALPERSRAKKRKAG